MGIGEALERHWRGIELGQTLDQWAVDEGTGRGPGDARTRGRGGLGPRGEGGRRKAEGSGRLSLLGLARRQVAVAVAVSSLCSALQDQGAGDLWAHLLVAVRTPSRLVVGQWPWLASPWLAWSRPTWPLCREHGLLVAVLSVGVSSLFRGGGGSGGGVDEDGLEGKGEER